jgi:hypothetical protein
MKRLLLTTALAATGLLALGATGASAATIEVTTTSDPASPVCPSSNNCSFREAVTSADDGDVISIPAGTYTLSLGEVVAFKQLTIRGAGRNKTILDASGLSPSASSRVLRIAGAVSGVTTIQGLTARGGQIIDGSRAGGAGIRCNSREGIVLSNVRLTDNSVNAAADFRWVGGAGLWSIGTAIIKRNSLIDQNSVVVTESIGQSGGGGAMVSGDYSGANLIVSNSTVEDNTADVTTATDLGYIGHDGGGGLYAAGNDLILRSAALLDNVASVDNSWGDSGGGGAYVSRGDLQAEGSTIEGNSAIVAATEDVTFSPANASSDGGGGAYVSGLNANISGSDFYSNSTVVNDSWGESGGGALYVSSRDEDSGKYIGDIRATRTTFRGNSVEANPSTSGSQLSSHYGGGAIYQDSHDLLLSQTTFASNSVDVNGQSFGAEAYSVNGGGAIYQYGNMTQISRSTFSNNSAQLPLATRSGGGALMDNAQSSFITNSTFSGNHATFDETATQGDTNGGGAIIYVADSDGAVLANVTIANNRVTGAAGGALVPYSTELRVGNSILASNSATVAGSSECSYTDGIVDWGLVTSLGYNLTNDTTDSCNLNAAGDRVGNANLASLAKNGGFTKTRAIGKKSAARNKGNPNGCESAYGELLTIDQRGFSRPWPKGSRCDIGAFEWRSSKKK